MSEGWYRYGVMTKVGTSHSSASPPDFTIEGLLDQLQSFTVGSASLMWAYVLELVQGGRHHDEPD